MLRGCGTSPGPPPGAPAPGCSRGPAPPSHEALLLLGEFGGPGALLRAGGRQGAAVPRADAQASPQLPDCLSACRGHGSGCSWRGCCCSGTSPHHPHASSQPGPRFTAVLTSGRPPKASENTSCLGHYSSKDRDEAGAGKKNLVLLFEITGGGSPAQLLPGTALF